MLTWELARELRVLGGEKKLKKVSPTSTNTTLNLRG